MAAPGLGAEVRLAVDGALSGADDRLLARVDLSNQGDAAARALEVEGELLGSYDQGRLEALAPGSAGSVTLRFPLETPRPGVHPLALHLRYLPEGAAEGTEPTSQRAYLLVAVGANPAPSVRLTMPPARLADHTLAPVELESADGEPHRIGLRVLAPRGLNALGPEDPVEVPARGVVRARVRLLRGSAPGGSRAGLVVLASELDGPLARTAVTTAEVEMVAVGPWLPRLRRPLVGLALALLGAAVAVEAGRLWSRRPA